MTALSNKFIEASKKAMQITNELEKLQDKFEDYVKMTVENGELVPIFSKNATSEIKKAYYDYVKMFKENEELLNIR